MLRMYLLQCWFSLSDEGVEDAIYCTVAAKLLHKDDKVVCGDSSYLGLQSREEVKQAPHLSSIECRINRRPRQEALCVLFRIFAPLGRML